MADDEANERIEISCPVCIAGGKADFATLLCGHVFHVECLEQAFKHDKSRAKRCPSCRVRE